MIWNGTEPFFFTKQVHMGAVCTKPGAKFVKCRCVFFVDKTVVSALTRFDIILKSQFSMTVFGGQKNKGNVANGVPDFKDTGILNI